MDSRFSFLRDLERAATPSPWATHLVDDTTVIANDGTTIAETFPDGGLDDDVDFFSPVERHEADARLVVAMRNALPVILDDIAAARAEIDKLRAALAQAATWFQGYADGHTAKGDADKAARNQSRANACIAAIDAALAEKEPAK